MRKKSPPWTAALRSLPRPAGEGGSNERGEGREAMEDGEQEIISQGADDGVAWFLKSALRRRWMGRGAAALPAIAGADGIDCGSCWHLGKNSVKFLGYIKKSYLSLIQIIFIIEISSLTIYIYQKMLL